MSESEDTDASRLAIRKRAMDMLARREHARAELIAKLARGEYCGEDIDGVLDDLTAEGLQSDARFAEAAVASKARRGIGPVRIRIDLRSAGVGDADIEAALAQAGVDWVEIAEAARRKRFGPALPTDFPTRAKQMRFLQRRGFDGDQLAAALDD